MFDMVSFESYLGRRFRRSMGLDSKLTFEVTTDIAQIHQYTLLLSNMFINLCGGVLPPVPRDEFDESSTFVVARKGRQCLGGCRVTFKEPGGNTPLPVEQDGGSLSSLLRHLPLASVRLAEVSNMRTMPDDTGVLQQGLLQTVLSALVQHKVRFAFISAPPGEVRAYKAQMETAGFISSVLNGDAAQTIKGQEARHDLLVIDLAAAYKINVKQGVNSERDLVLEN